MSRANLKCHTAISCSCSLLTLLTTTTTIIIITTITAVVLYVSSLFRIPFLLFSWISLIFIDLLHFIDVFVFHFTVS
jgi:hypothetical protein